MTSRSDSPTVTRRTLHTVDVMLGPGWQTLRISLVPPHGREPGSLRLQLGHGGQGLPDPFTPKRGAGAELLVPVEHGPGLRDAVAALGVLLEDES